ncbi:KTSC domain-containing protein [Mesorhizobium sp. M7A.F.Ca.US.001.04.1.1]|nr:KTSC domain-containing protein [Mesorhizobium sp. M7A.F.Ca.US.001.04.2.1]RUY42433.1 KTSC domain-containing protein [Mesorhizobium sp. M7A.F.Ca.US.001.04.1.1]RVA07706.1 KTSC domain-containing protein [Mesorhizobium sp. M7A.F.Ca.US.001.02.1.1]
MPSTSILKFEYDPNTRVLSVWFVASGRQYEFLDVPPETFADFKSAFAKGRYFNDRIRNHFAFRPVAQAPTPAAHVGADRAKQPGGNRACPTAGRTPDRS